MRMIKLLLDFTKIFPGSDDCVTKIDNLNLLGGFGDSGLPTVLV